MHGAAHYFGYSRSAQSHQPRGQEAGPGLLTGSVLLLGVSQVLCWQGHGCCWQHSGLQAGVATCGGRSIAGPRQLLLPSGCSVVVITIIGIIKMIFFFFFQWVFPGLLWSQQLQPWWAWAVLMSCSVLGGGHGEMRGGVGVILQNLTWKGQSNLEKPMG